MPQFLKLIFLDHCQLIFGPSSVECGPFLLVIVNYQFTGRVKIVSSGISILGHSYFGPCLVHSGACSRHTSNLYPWTMGPLCSHSMTKSPRIIFLPWPWVNDDIVFVKTSYSTDVFAKLQEGWCFFDGNDRGNKSNPWTESCCSNNQWGGHPWWWVPLAQVWAEGCQRKSKPKVPHFITSDWVWLKGFMKLASF